LSCLSLSNSSATIAHIWNINSTTNKPFVEQIFFKNNSKLLKVGFKTAIVGFKTVVYGLQNGSFTFPVGFKTAVLLSSLNDALRACFAPTEKIVGFKTAVWASKRQF